MAQLKQEKFSDAGSECHFSSWVWFYIFSSFPFLFLSPILKNSGLAFVCLIKSILWFIAGGCEW